MPIGFLVDDNRALIDTFAGAETAEFSCRIPSLDILELIHHRLRLTLSGAIKRVMNEN